MKKQLGNEEERKYSVLMRKTLYLKVPSIKLKPEIEHEPISAHLVDKKGLGELKIKDDELAIVYVISKDSIRE